ncbi:hypothetical protein PQ786_01775 [Alcaligenes faecalis]
MISKAINSKMIWSSMVSTDRFKAVSLFARNFLIFSVLSFVVVRIGAWSLFTYFGLNSTEAAAWVQGIGTVGAVLVAVWVANHQAVSAANQATELANKELNSFLLGIRHELSQHFEMYMKEIGGAVNNEVQGCHLIIPALPEDSFKIYRSGVSLIGRIVDDELREKIIKTIISFESLMSGWKLHKYIVERYIDKYDDANAGEDAKDLGAALERAEGLALDHFGVISNVQKRVEREIKECIASLDKELEMNKNYLR